jgi:sensor histidine kinase regulating citrate/malate metabolism
LEEGLETQLNHCQGLGLWLAKWIVDNGDGQLAFPTTGEPQIRVEFVRLDPDEGP